MGYICNIIIGRRICFEGWFGDYCDIFCFLRIDLVGYYICNSGIGVKECLFNWYGENCIVYC